MDRRRFLALCGALTAGCLGGQPNGTPDGNSRTARPTSRWTATPTPRRMDGTATPTETPTETPTDTPTETPEPDPEPTGPNEDAADAIDAARDHLDDAVDTYRGDAASMADVTAESDDFSARAVLLALDAAQREIWRAREYASTDDQTTTADALHAVERFLTHSTVAQAHFVEALNVLEAVYTAFDDDEYETAIDRSDHLERIQNRAADAVDAAFDAADEDDASDADVDGLDEDEFAEQVDHLDAADAGVDDLREAVSLTLRGWDLLAEARDYRDDGDDDEALDTAEKAERRLSRALELTDDVDDDGPDSLSDVASDLDDFASDKEDETADLIDEVE